MKAFILVVLFYSFLSPVSAWQNDPAMTAYRLADSLYQKADFRAARTPAEKAITLFQKQENWKACFDAQVLHHILLRNLYKKKSSFKAIQKALQTHQQYLKNDYRLAELHTYLGQSYASQSNVKESLHYLQLAQELILEQSPVDTALLALTHLGYALASTNKTDQTISNYNRGLELLQAANIDAPYLKGQILRGLGNVNRVQSDFEQAIQYYEEELKTYLQHYPPDHFDIAAVHYNLGTIHYELLHYQKAIDHYQKAYPSWSKRWKPEDTYMRYLNESLGDLYFELEKYRKALIYFDRSVVGEKKINKDTSLLLTNEGLASANEGQYDLALEYYQKAFDFRKQFLGTRHPLTGACNTFIANVYKQKGQLDIALQSYQHSLIMMTNGFQDSSIYSNPTLSNIINPDYYLLETVFSKSELLLEKYYRDSLFIDLEAAFQTLQFSVQLIDLIRKSPISEGSKLLWTQKAFPIYELAIATGMKLSTIANDPIYLEHCFAIAEKSKSFLLLSSLHEKEIQQFEILSSDLQAEEAQLKSSIRNYSGKIMMEEKRCADIRPNKLKVWQQQLFSLQADYDDFINRLKKQQPGYYHLKYDVSTSSITAIQKELLDERQALLEFFEGEDKGFLFVITSEAVDCYMYPKDSLYDQQINTIRQWLSNGTSENNTQSAFLAYRQAAAALYQQLLAKPLAVLDTSIQRLIIIPDGHLSYLPFECLLTTTTGPSDRNYSQLPYLLHNYAIAYGQSATLAHRANHQSKQSVQRHAFIGFAPAYNYGEANDSTLLAPLQYNSNEVATAAELFNGKEYKGEAANKAAFISQADQANILHLALHATVEDENPLLSSLYFSAAASDSTEGQLFAYELYDFQLNASLAVLSACNTGTGSWIRGEGMMSLARCFQYAGCPSLLTSLWTVDDQSTAALMNDFYVALKAQDKKDLALQQAKLNYLKTADPATAHPAYWAAFTLQGNTESIAFSSEVNLWLYLLPLLLLCLPASLWIYRKKRTNTQLDKRQAVRAKELSL